MVVVSKKEGFKRRIASKKWLCFTISLGLFFLLVPIVFLFIDPILIIAKYYIRLANGTMLHELMLAKVEGPRIYVSLFNFTNAEEYKTGRDEKMKLNEVGPFVYQEYRINQDLVIDPETYMMTYTPRLWTEFIPEESIGDPKDVYLTMPSIPMLAGTDMMSKYPFFFRNIFNILAAGLHSKVVVNITAHDYLWGYPEPFIKFANTAVPGLFYYNSGGIMERIYDAGANYTLEIGTKDVEKFSVKKVKKFREKKQTKSDGLIENIQTFSNTYEGAVFPPGITPETPIYIFRQSVCKTFKLQHTGFKRTQFGTQAFTYDFANETLNDHQLCDTKGWCPVGLLNLAPCYYNFPLALSKGHFLDADPRLLDRIEGIKPDKKLHSTELVVDPTIGVMLSAKSSIQLSLALGDLGYNSEAKRFKDTVLPLCHAILKHPKMPLRAQNALVLMYFYGPYILITVIVLCLLLSSGLLAYSAMMLYWNWAAENRVVVFESKLRKSLTDAYVPLMVH